jgi:hypothetical protein
MPVEEESNIIDPNLESIITKCQASIPHSEPCRSVPIIVMQEFFDGDKSPLPLLKKRSKNHNKTSIRESDKMPQRPPQKEESQGPIITPPLITPQQPPTIDGTQAP